MHVSKDSMGWMKKFWVVNFRSGSDGIQDLKFFRCGWRDCWRRFWPINAKPATRRCLAVFDLHLYFFAHENKTISDSSSWGHM